MNVGLAVHGWYHPLAEKDTYISAIEISLNSVGIVSERIRGHNLPNGKISQLVVPSVLKYFMNYGTGNYDIIHDTRGDSVFKNVDVSTIQDLYLYKPKNEPFSKLLNLTLKKYQDYRRTLQLSRQIIVTNTVVRQEIEHFFGTMYNEKIKTVPIPFEYGPIEKGDDRYDVIWVGSSARRKRLPLFLKYISYLPKSYRIGVKLTYVDKYVSDDRKLIENTIRNLQNDGRHIEVISNSKSWDFLTNLYKSSKCLVSTSSYEGFHMPVAEAYLKGVRVILPKNELYISIYGDAEGVNYYDNEEQLPARVIEAVESGKFLPDQRIVNYLSFHHVGSLLKEVYEEAMKY